MLFTGAKERITQLYNDGITSGMWDKYFKPQNTKTTFFDYLREKVRQVNTKKEKGKELQHYQDLLDTAVEELNCLPK